MSTQNDSSIEVPSTVTMRRVFRTWWPLAASWLLMSVEQPALGAVVARLADPEIHLAAWGGIVFPLALIIESPIIMLLAASTALSKDWASYLRIRRFMMWTSASLTALHLLVALTPLYEGVAVTLLGVPDAIVEPGRTGLILMLPWTWSIAYRRFQQGVLIRFGHTGAVGTGTIIRLAADGLILAIGYWLHTLPGIVVGASAIAAGVVSEAAYSGLRVQAVLRQQVRTAAPVDPPLTQRAFLAFYIPLAMTSLLNLLLQPIGSAAMSRMPRPLESLAVWPVLSGLLFILRSPGIAYNEVVVALLDDPGADRALRRFTAVLIGLTTALALLVTATPLSELWFGRFSALNPQLSELARSAFWFALPLPGLNTLQSWFQGTLVNRRHTRGVTEAVAIFLLTSGAILWAGVLRQSFPGLPVALVAFSSGACLQTAWLWFRRRRMPGFRNRRSI